MVTKRILQLEIKILELRRCNCLGDRRASDHFTQYTSEGCSAHCADIVIRILPRPTMINLIETLGTFERLNVRSEADIRLRIENFSSKDRSEGSRLAWNTLFESYSESYVIARRCEQRQKEMPLVVMLHVKT